MVQTAFVTGADRGLGRALSEVLLLEGFHVYAGQYMPEWGELAVLKEKFEDRLTVLELNVDDIESVRRCAMQAENDFGYIDIVINNAAIYADRLGDLFADIDYEAAMRMQPMGVAVWAFHPGWVRSYMLGVLNEEATVEPMDSARGLVDIMLRGRASDDPMYVDYQGKPLVW